MIPQIDLARQHAALRAELLEAAARVLASCRFILGPEVQALEGEIATACGAPHAVGVNSGTDALLLALEALDIGPGDEVITSAFSFVASASTIVLAGARPVFVDIDPATFNLDPAGLRAAVTPRTRAIVPVHLYGHPAAMDAIVSFARARGLAVVEDAAQALGATYDGRPVGSWGDAACLSFYPTKNLGACGDGGMVVTVREDLAGRLRRLRDHGSARKYEHVEIGRSSRLDEIQAAFLRVKLRRLEAWTAARRRLAGRYRALLAGLPVVLPEERPPARHVYHQYTIRVPDRDAVAAALAARGVGTSVHYPATIPAQPAFAGRAAGQAFPHATRAAATVLGLPCFAELTDEEVSRVAEALGEALGAGTPG
jgi:dTDP-4-amino-4,6-dideoxygalactose transaminase